MEVEKPRPKPGMICPLHKQDMAEVCPTCPLWIQVRGKDPQSEQEFDRWHCSLAWLPALIIENSQQQRHTGAAVESFRNEVVRSSERILASATERRTEIQKAADILEIECQKIDES